MTTPDKPQKQLRLFQFAPSLECHSYPGVYGWGFDSHGYRFVVYAPEAFDHPVVQSRIHEIKEHMKQAPAEENTHTGRLDQSKTETLRKRRKTPLIERKNEEHGPSHVHVFHIASGRETRFELLEHYLHDEHKSRPFFTGSKHEHPLTKRDMEIVQPILKEHIPAMIQAWREFHQDSRLSTYVTRISRCEGEDVEEKVGTDGWLYTTDSRGNVAKSPPPSMYQEKAASHSQTRSRDGFYHQR